MFPAPPGNLLATAFKLNKYGDSAVKPQRSSSPKTLAKIVPNRSEVRLVLRGLHGERDGLKGKHWVGIAPGLPGKETFVLSLCNFFIHYCCHTASPCPSHCISLSLSSARQFLVHFRTILTHSSFSVSRKIHNLKAI